MEIDLGTVVVDHPDQHVTRLRDEGMLTAGQVSEWWSWLDLHEAGGYACGATVFVVTGTRPR